MPTVLTKSSSGNTLHEGGGGGGVPADLELDVLETDVLLALAAAPAHPGSVLSRIWIAWCSPASWDKAQHEASSISDFIAAWARKWRSRFYRSKACSTRKKFSAFIVKRS